MHIVVRPAVRRDADAICDAHVAAWRVGYRHIFPDSILDDEAFDRMRRDRWRSWTHSPTADRQMLVGVVDGRVVGFAHTGLTSSATSDQICGVRDERPCGELFGFYVHPESWGSGVATAMMDAALDHLASLGHDRAVLWTFTEAKRAQAFYAKAGWRPTGVTDVLDMYPDHPADDLELEITGLLARTVTTGV